MVGLPERPLPLPPGGRVSPSAATLPKGTPIRAPKPAGVRCQLRTEVDLVLGFRARLLALLGQPIAILLDTYMRENPGKVTASAGAYVLGLRRGTKCTGVAPRVTGRKL